MSAGNDRSWERRIPGGSLAILAASLALLLAAGPAFAQSFTGPQQRISQQGPDGNAGFDGRQAAVAANTNTATGEYLVVWSGDDDAPPLDPDEREIYGRLIGPGGVPKAPAFRISDMGPDGDPLYDASLPRVAFNPEANEYLVAWRGSDDAGALVADESEVFGQRLSGAGTQIGPNDFRISDMGPDGNLAFRANGPSVAYSAADDRYLVVWSGDDDTPPLVDNEFEVFGQLLDPAGNAVGPNDFRISDMGPNASVDYSAAVPDIAPGSNAGGFLVTWHGDDDTPPLVEGEVEVFGQRLSGAGAELGLNDFRISDMGPDGETDFVGTDSAVAFNPVANESLVVWLGDSDFPLDDDELEIFGQRLSATGAALGTNDFRISQMGPDGFSAYRGTQPDVTHNAADNQYLAVWNGDDDTPPLVDDEFEVFAQRISAAGVPFGHDDFRVSRMGPDGDPAFGSQDPVAAFAGEQYLIAWEADDDAPQIDGEVEIFARGLAGAEPPDPDPDPTDTAVTLVIVGKKLVLNRKRKTAVRLTCPEQEASPPCEGTLALVTRKRVRVAAKRKLRLARKGYSIDAGKTKRLKLRLSKKHARIVRRNKKARKVLAKTKVTDAAGNTAKVKKKAKLKPKRRKKK